MIFGQQLKITFRKSSAPPLKKSTPPFLVTPHLKIQKMQVSPPFLQTLKIFQAPPAERREEDTVNTGLHNAVLDICSMTLSNLI